MPSNAERISRVTEGGRRIGRAVALAEDGTAVGISYMRDKAAAEGIDGPRQIEVRMPLGRIFQPEDVAHAVGFLVSGSGSYTTSENINVTGGDGVAAPAR